MVHYSDFDDSVNIVSSSFYANNSSVGVVNMVQNSHFIDVQDTVTLDSSSVADESINSNVVPTTSRERMQLKRAKYHITETLNFVSREQRKNILSALLEKQEVTVKDRIYAKLISFTSSLSCQLIILDVFYVDIIK